MNALEQSLDGVFLAVAQKKSGSTEGAALFWQQLESSSLKALDSCIYQAAVMWREVLVLYSTEELPEELKQTIRRRLPAGESELPPLLFRRLETEREKSFLGFMRYTVLQSYFISMWALLDQIGNLANSAVNEGHAETNDFASIIFNDGKASSLWRFRGYKEQRRKILGAATFFYALRNQFAHVGPYQSSFPIFKDQTLDYGDLIFDEWSSGFLDIFLEGKVFPFIKNQDREVRQKFIDSVSTVSGGSVAAETENVVSGAAPTPDAAASQLTEAPGLVRVEPVPEGATADSIPLVDESTADTLSSPDSTSESKATPVIASLRECHSQMINFSAFILKLTKALIEVSES